MRTTIRIPYRTSASIDRTARRIGEIIGYTLGWVATYLVSAIILALGLFSTLLTYVCWKGFGEGVNPRVMPHDEPGHPFWLVMLAMSASGALVFLTHIRPRDWKRAVGLTTRSSKSSW